MARLILLLPNGTTRQVNITALPFSIGRMPGCDLVIDDPLVSRRHALIEQADGGTLRVSDVDSHNGTFVNGKRIRSCVLAHGDELRLAESVVRYLAHGSELAQEDALRLVTMPGKLDELELRKLAPPVKA